MANVHLVPRMHPFMLTTYPLLIALVGIEAI